MATNCTHGETATSDDEYQTWTREAGKVHYTAAGITIHARDIPGNATPAEARRQFPIGYSVLSTTDSTPRTPPIEYERHFEHANECFASLQPWESEILIGTNLQTDELTTVNAISSPSIVACDGSVNSHEAGSFGWAFSDLEGHRKAIGSGPVRGSRITSYRAEGYSILSVTRFLHRLQEHTRSPQRMDKLQSCATISAWSTISTSYSQLLTNNQTSMALLEHTTRRFNHCNPNGTSSPKYGTPSKRDPDSELLMPKGIKTITQPWTCSR